MAFATVIHLEMNLEGNRKIVCGHKGSAEEAAAAVVNADLPLASGDVAIHCVSGDVVYFQAIGQ